jgi:hypothetical protein
MKAENNASYCSSCGYSFGELIHGTFQQSMIGFSSKINDPAFAKYIKQSNSWSAIFSLILAVIAAVGFPVYGRVSGEIDWPNSLYYGLGIGGMFVIIALIQIMRRSLEKTWDGIVVFKDSYRIRERSDDGHFHSHILYILKIKKASGGTKKHKWRDTPGPYSYYNVGDKVRHHKGFYYYEKYDKSHDSEIMCAACNTFQDIRLDRCQRCNCPLLK